MPRHLAVALALLAAACAPAADTSAQTETAESVALTAAGDPAQLAPLEADDNLQWAASVVRVDFLENQEGGGAKLFGTAGGDPAMNGLYTHIAFFQGAADGWRVFRLGDFLDYRVLADSPGRVELEIQESTIDSDGVIGGRTRHVIVTWTSGEDSGWPEAISVTPARAEN